MTPPDAPPGARLSRVRVTGARTITLDAPRAAITAFVRDVKTFFASHRRPGRPSRPGHPARPARPDWHEHHRRSL